jgi:hypothetical protein
MTDVRAAAVDSRAAQLQVAGRELAERSCAAQGIPVRLSRAELDRLAPLFRVQPAARPSRTT